MLGLDEDDPGDQRQSREPISIMSSTLVHVAVRSLRPLRSRSTQSIAVMLTDYRIDALTTT